MKPEYLCLFVGKGWCVERRRRGAPTMNWLCERAKEQRASFAIRKASNREEWWLIDIRRAYKVAATPSNRFWAGHERSNRVYPNADAAVMHAMAILDEQPQLL